ncbi:Ppx/GppA phosphatase [Neorhizobium galegae bv. officinalis bv. officinalis str. HAMBI 1141]|uniref:Ppx/GppA phosphatase n=2 Tax=Neorhizobium galegae TaxID=399 RepID=A0A068T2P1_NEOGA|nr:Ppx/GppA phosphatase [Neorhizobium galegae bv. officinalis bv. officinalis str. HAMBI 1141]
MDPDSGAKPPEGGASAVPRGEGKSSRRRKAKRNGKRRDAAPASHSDAVDTAAPAGRPHNQEPNPQARKRKRRRAKSGGAQQPAQGAGAAPVTEQGQVRVEGGQQPHSAKSPPRNRRKKNRGGRGLQGRPLTPAKAVPGVAKTPAPAGSGQGSSKDARGRAGNESQGTDSRGEKFSYVNDLYAALDLGTNNCRLLIAQPTRPGQFRVVDAFSRIVRLGEGLGTSRRLSQDAMDRAVEALRICATKLANRPIRRMRLIATEACRAAENGEEFLARVISETGLELEIIDRETEARLAVSGCSSLVGREARSVVLFDIGGGSSEIAVIRIDDSRSSRLANHITHWTSLPVGVVTLSERHGGRDVTPEVFDAMVTEVEGMLAGFDCPPLAAFRRQGAEDFHLIGTSGTVTTLAGVHLDLPRYDRRKVDGLWLSDAEVSAMQAKLLSWDFAGRAANPCIGPDRADLVLAGCAILEAIRRRWPSQRMRVADRGLREGLLTDMMADDGVWRRVRPRRPGGNQAGNPGAGGQDEAGARR